MINPHSDCPNAHNAALNARNPRFAQPKSFAVLNPGLCSAQVFAQPKSLLNPSRMSKSRARKFLLKINTPCAEQARSAARFAGNRE
jgi:hypothetical protein